VTGTGKGRSRLGWALAGVVAVIVVLGGIVVATRGDDDTVAPASSVGDGDGGDGSSADPAGGTATTAPPAAPGPVDAMASFVAAVNRRDCSALVDLLVADTFAGETREAAVDACNSEFSSGTSDLDAVTFGAVTPVSEDGDTAVVAVEVTARGQTTSQPFPMRRVDGVWRVVLEDING
jgi:hypothetical protein